MHVCVCRYMCVQVRVCGVSCVCKCMHVCAGVCVCRYMREQVLAAKVHVYACHLSISLQHVLGFRGGSPCSLEHFKESHAIRAHLSPVSIQTSHDPSRKSTR